MNWNSIIQNKKIGVFFSDPGAAKPLLALQKLYDANFRFFSNKLYDFYTNFNINVQIIDENELEKVFTLHKFDLTLLGTSYTNNFELSACKISKLNNIENYTFIDNWSGLEARFRRNEMYNIPEKIIVVDNFAKEVFKKQTAKYKTEIFALNNPYHSYLKTWKPAFSKQFIYDKFALNQNYKTVIYAPDPLSNVGGINKYGFDEYFVYEKLFNTAERNYNLIFKLHPNQHIHFFKDKIDDKTILIKDNIYINELIYYSDLLISFFSNILIESHFLGTKSLRFINDLKIEDNFYFDDIKCFDNNISIFEYLNNIN